MKQVHVLAVVLTIILLVSSASLLISYTQSLNGQKDTVYVGVAFGGETVAQAKLLIDKVKGYTNLFILDSGINPISTNESAAKEICDYAVNAGLNVIINMGSWTPWNWPWQIQFLNSSRNLYGEKFLGAYYDDEPGGIPLDWNWTKQFAENKLTFGNGTSNPLNLTPIYNKIQISNATGVPPQNYTIEAEWFHQLLSRNRGHNDLKKYNITSFTSDYALFWYDYLGGYSTLFAQLGWSQNDTPPSTYRSFNEQISLALLRGAATLQNKDWGAIVTWKYTQPPYLDTGENVYDQMVLAYNYGAKYITVFDYPYNITGNAYGTLTEEHFQALQKFWNLVTSESNTHYIHAEAALVLPKDYGFGLRNPTDKIWGFWGPDDKSPIVWNATQTLLARYGLGLDIVYDDPAFPIQGNYSRVYYWNQTI